MSHTLTPEQEQARGELMAHMTRKPKSHDAFDLEAWHDRKAVLEAELAKAMGGAQAPRPLPPDVPRNPKPKEAAMPPAPGKPGHLGGKAKPGPKPGAPPQERLDAAVAAYHACEDSRAKKKAKARIYGICSYTGLPLPELPDGRKANHVTKTLPPGRIVPPTRVYDSNAQVAPPPQMQEPTVPQPEGHLPAPVQIAMDLGRAMEREVRNPQPLDAIRASISGIRAQTWSLLATLERLTPEQLAELGPELGMMDEAAHITTRLAERSAA